MKTKGFYGMVRSQHPTHNALRMAFKTPYRSVIRLGSTTDLADTMTNGGSRIEINTIEAVKNSANKLRMKKCFAKVEVSTADWWYWNDGKLVYNTLDHQEINSETLPYPMVLKHTMGSRNRGNTLIKTQEEFNQVIQGKNLSEYILEKYYSYAKEYRLHVTEDGCFYTCRKMIKKDTPDDRKWFKNSENSVWILEENESFEKPSCWNEIVNDCVLALKSLGLDFAAFDVRVQNEKDNKGNQREEVDFILLESNSAPSLQEIGIQKYLDVLPKLIIKKANK